MIGSISIPQYVHIHQGNSPVVKTEYAEIQDIRSYGLIQKSVYGNKRIARQFMGQYIAPHLT